MNIVKYLDKQAEMVPERIALIMNENGMEKSIDFRQLREKTAVFATALQQNGLQAGDRAILMIPMSIELYIAMLGIIRMGASAIFIDPWISHRQIAQFAAFADAKAFIGIGRSHSLRLLNRQLLRLPLTITTGTSFCGIPARYSFSNLMKTTPDYQLFECAGDDSALITFTSGSSGSPKGANRTHGFLSAQHIALQQEFKYQAGDVDMPMFPVFALNNLASGITSVIPDMDFCKVTSVDAGRIYRQIQKYGVTTATASPPFFARLAEYSQKLNQLRRILTGGAPVASEQLKLLRNAWSETEIQIIFGSTEAEPVAHLSLEERMAAEKKDLPGYCVGKPVKAIKAGVIAISRDAVEWDEDMKKIFLPDGEIGELVVSGDHVCRDYFHNSSAVKLNKIRDKDGVFWHRMGDTGYFDEQGNFYLVGRVHSAIFTKSGIVHAQIVEKIAQTIISGRAALVGLPDDDGYEKAVLVVNEPRTEKLELQLKTLPEIREVIFTGKSLPSDPRHNSKIDYAMLRELILRGKI